MRRWLLLILVLLLPLRGLAAVAMAGQMLEQHAAPVTAVHGAQHGSRAQHDCEDHHGRAPQAAAMEDPAGATAGGELPGDCPTCASCQACSALVLAPTLPPALVEAPPQAPPQVAMHVPASAEPALALKPPRS